MTRSHLLPAASQRRPTVALLLGLALAFCLAVLSIQSSFFAAPGTRRHSPHFRIPRADSIRPDVFAPPPTAGAPGRRLDLDAGDVRELAGFQSRVQRCVVRLRGRFLTEPQLLISPLLVAFRHISAAKKPVCFALMLRCYI